MAYTNTRCPAHDYHSKAAYLITIGKNDGIMDFSRCFRGNGSAVSKAGVITSPVGDAIKNALRNIPSNFQNASILQYIIMPDHIHFVIDIKKRSDYHLGDLIATFKAEVTKSLPYGTIFTEGYHDRIKKEYIQLRRMIDYVADNPRRYIIRKENRNRFNNPHIINLWGDNYVAYGNFLLLRNPSLANVRISRSYSPEQLRGLKKRWDDCIRENGVLISPFINPAEKEVLNKGIENGSNIILITREEIRERWKPSGRLFDLCSEGRLLVISTQKAVLEPKLSRSEALAMNNLAARIASEALSELKVSKMSRVSTRAVDRTTPGAKAPAVTETSEN